MRESITLIGPALIPSFLLSKKPPQCAVADLMGAQGCAPPPGQNSFNFMQFLGNFGKILCWRPPPGELAPPSSGKSWIRHLCAIARHSRQRHKVAGA